DAGYDKLIESDLDLVVANDIERVGREMTSCVIVRRDGSGTTFSGLKTDLAKMLYEEISKGLGVL
ncbi:MAG: hypothetical protein L0Z54_03940, partial [Thermoplasmata archaeon]|nr:hypothetical protein [Thermoplasmata archaeon]